MRELPNIPDQILTACLETHYGLTPASIRSLPPGYDLSAWVYEVVGEDRTAYFLKVRAGPVNVAGLRAARTLSERGIENVPEPLETRTGELWCPLGAYSVVLYPFIRGENAAAVGLNDAQWRQFGAVLRAVHSSGLADRFRGHLREETFALPSGEVTRSVGAHVEGARFESPVAARFAGFWKENTPRIRQLVEHAESLADRLRRRSFEHVLCHGDAHAANVLAAEDGRVFLVDWDGPLIAPRERDLLFVVGSRIARRVEPGEEALFFEGYGAWEVDRTALAYYRCERVIEDIGEFGRSILLDSDLSEEVREDSARLVLSFFEPGSDVEFAMESLASGRTGKL